MAVVREGGRVFAVWKGSLIVSRLWLACLVEGREEKEEMMRGEVSVSPEFMTDSTIDSESAEGGCSPCCTEGVGCHLQGGSLQHPTLHLALKKL